MGCKVCGEEFSGNGKCPRCEFMLPPVVGTLTPEMEKKREEAANAFREKVMKNIKVYIRGYHWEEENGQLVEKFHEDILIAENIHKLNPGQTSLSEVVFAKQTAGEPVELTVVVENEGMKENSVTITAPDTGEDMWNVGFSYKPGLRGVVKIGSGTKFTDSNEFSLKG